MAVTHSDISWTDSTWSPIRGCSRVSTGCEACYAERQAGRFSGPGQPYEGLVRKTSQGFRWTGEVRLIEQDLDRPLHWRKPRRIFVNSMSDLFHESVPDAWIDRIFDVMIQAQHIFQILTKRPERMHQYVTRWLAPAMLPSMLENIWLGVSIEDQTTADARIPWLLQTPAVMRFVSAEPLLEDIRLERYLGDLPEDEDGAPYPGAIAWLICGGESGPKARPCDLAWLRSVVQQCHEAGVACWVKQLGTKPYSVSEFDQCYGFYVRDRKGADPQEWPEDLRVQHFPKEGKR